ncbi:MAG: hypothetical protein AAGD32_14040 [Planctomycetota bacterium]
MANDTLTMADLMTIEQIDVAYPDSHVFIDDVQLDDEGNIVAGRVAHYAETKLEAQRLTREHVANKPEEYWFSCGYRYTGTPKVLERMGHLILSPMVADR